MAAGNRAARRHNRVLCTGLLFFYAPRNQDLIISKYIIYPPHIWLMISRGMRSGAACATYSKAFQHNEDDGQISCVAAIIFVGKNREKVKYYNIVPRCGLEKMCWKCLQLQIFWCAAPGKCIAQSGAKQRAHRILLFFAFITGNTFPTLT